MRDRRPNIKTLLKREKVDALVAAAYYREPTPNPSGGVSDAGVPVRAEAILALGKLGPTAGRRAVLAGLRDPADPVRCAAVRALHARRDPYALVRALEWLPSEGRSRSLALQTVLDLRRLVIPALLVETLIHRRDEEVLGEDEGALVLGLLEDDQTDATGDVVELLVGALGHERGIVIDRAMDLLVLLAPASTDAVVEQLRAGPAAAEAAYVLGRIGDPQTVDVLVESLAHSNPLVRAESAAALAELRDPSAVSPLLRATQDPEHAVRRQAAMALERVGTAAVIAGIAELLEPMVNEAVRTALAKAKPEDDHSPKPSRTRKRQPRAPRSNGKAPRSAKPRSTPKSGSGGKARVNGKASAPQDATPARDANAESTAPAAHAPSVEAEPAARQPSNGKPASTESADAEPGAKPRSSGKTASTKRAKAGSSAKPRSTKTAANPKPRSRRKTAAPKSAETEPSATTGSATTTGATPAVPLSESAPVTEGASEGADARRERGIHPAAGSALEAAGRTPRVPGPARGTRGALATGRAQTPGRQVAVVAPRVELRLVAVAANLAQAAPAPLAGPVVDEHGAEAVVGRADATEALMRAIHGTQQTGARRACFARSYEIRPQRGAAGRPPEVSARPARRGCACSAR